MLSIGKHEYDALRQHGEETYPFECCGALLGHSNGDGRRVQKTIRCSNIRADRPQDRYQIDPKELLAIHRQASEQGMEIVGFYHSHPDHPAQWSQTDFAEAHWLGCSYVITSVQKGVATITNSFALTGDNEENKRLDNEQLSILAIVEQHS